MSPFAVLTVLYDACVLYPAPLRDFLMHVATTGLYRARWTEEIHDEWIRNVLENRPDLTPSQLQRTRELMNAHVLDCLVTGYETLIPKLQLPDPADRHVLAAAIQGGADVILTFNLKDFPGATLHPLGIEALHPDKFLESQLNLAPDILFAAAKQHRASLRKPPRSVAEYLRTLEAQGLTRTAAGLRHFAELL